MGRMCHLSEQNGNLVPTPQMVMCWRLAVYINVKRHKSGLHLSNFLKHSRVDFLNSSVTSLAEFQNVFMFRGIQDSVLQWGAMPIPEQWATLEPLLMADSGSVQSVQFQAHKFQPKNARNIDGSTDKWLFRGAHGWLILKCGLWNWKIILKVS